MKPKISKENHTTVNMSLGHKETENLDKDATKGTGKIMIIGVGGAGYHMASTIRREATVGALKNARYVFADQDKFFHDIIVKNEIEGYI